MFLSLEDGDRNPNPSFPFGESLSEKDVYRCAKAMQDLRAGWPPVPKRGEVK